MSPDFIKATENSKLLKAKPSNEVLLKLYGLYKQATEGDVSGDRPSGFDFKGAAKFDAWAKLKGKSQEIAQTEYIKFVEELLDAE